MHVRWIAREWNIRRPDEREVIFVRNREHHTTVGVLESVGLRTFIEPADDNMTALDQPQGGMPVRSRRVQNIFHPGTGRVHECPRAHRAPLTGA